jgi:hypothetical protein
VERRSKRNVKNGTMAELPVNVEKLTSEVFSTENPPKDWADLTFLTPHEALRREMSAMVVSVDALTPGGESWKVLLFAKWYSEAFYVMVHKHHDGEEKFYFPWVAKKAELPEKYSKEHVDLVKVLDDIREICNAVIKKKGDSCDEEISKLKEKIPPFVTDMKGESVSCCARVMYL